MLCSIKALDGLVLAARDGEIGHAREAYFDDARWVVRHVVAEAGSRLLGRRVLISPQAIVRVHRARRRLEVALTQRQIKDAPGICTDQPVSRQHEIPYDNYHGYPYYREGGGLWGMHEAIEVTATVERRTTDAHLLSSAEVIGCRVEASDGAIGHVDDVLCDDRSWQIRHVVIDTRNWLPGRLVLIDPASIARIDANARLVHVSVGRDAVKASPPYGRASARPQAEERRIQRHCEGWS